MPRRFDLLVFDWDGTLMDSAMTIVASLQSACADLGLPVPREDEARFIIGLGLEDAMAHILPNLEPAVYPQVSERYRHHYLLRGGETRLFGGADGVVRELHGAGFLLAVATGKSRRGLDHALAATGIAAYFHATRCADEGHSKPHPGMLETLMDELGTPSARTLMIGDTTHDMAMAKNAGVARLAVAYGAHNRRDLLAFEPETCVEDIAELRAWLLTHG